MQGGCREGNHVSGRGEDAETGVNKKEIGTCEGDEGMGRGREGMKEGNKEMKGGGRECACLHAIIGN